MTRILQTIPGAKRTRPRDIRAAFVPRDDDHQMLLSADYSQIELRIMADLSSEDESMIAKPSSKRRRHSHRDRIKGLQGRSARRSHPGDACQSQNGELRDHLWNQRRSDCNNASTSRAAEASELDQQLLREIPGRPTLHRPKPSPSRKNTATSRPKPDSTAIPSRHSFSEVTNGSANGSGTLGNEQSHPRHRRGHAEARHGPRPPRPGRTGRTSKPKCC